MYLLNSYDLDLDPMTLVPKCYISEDVRLRTKNKFVRRGIQKLQPEQDGQRHTHTDENIITPNSPVVVTNAVVACEIKIILK